MWPSALRMRFQWFPHSGKTRMTTHMWRVGPLAHRRWPGSCAGGAAVQPPDAIIACPPRIEDHLKRVRTCSFDPGAHHDDWQLSRSARLRPGGSAHS